MKLIYILVFPLFLMLQDGGCAKKQAKEDKVQTDVTEVSVYTDEKETTDSIEKINSPRQGGDLTQMEQNDSGEFVEVEQPSKSDIDEMAEGISDCIQDKIDFFIKERSFSQMAKIVEFKSKGKTYYLFDEGMALDAPGYILDEQCDTVCVTGGMRRKPADAAPCPKADEKSDKVLYSK